MASKLWTLQLSQNWRLTRLRSRATAWQRTDATTSPIHGFLIQFYAMASDTPKSVRERADALQKLQEVLIPYPGKGLCRLRR